MMKMIILIITLLVNSATWAQSPKVALVNIEGILLKSKFYPELNQRVEALINLKNQEVLDLEAKISSKEKAIQQGILTPEGGARLKVEIGKLKQEKNRLLAEGQKEVDELEVRLRQPVIKKILLTIKKVSQEKKYDLVLEESSAIIENSLTLENIDGVIIQQLNTL